MSSLSKRVKALLSPHSPGALLSRAAVCAYLAERGCPLLEPFIHFLTYYGGRTFTSYSGWGHEEVRLTSLTSESVIDVVNYYPQLRDWELTIGEFESYPFSIT